MYGFVSRKNMILFLGLLLTGAMVSADTKSDAAFDQDLGLLKKPWKIDKGIITSPLHKAKDPRAIGQPFFQQPLGAARVNPRSGQ